MMLALREIARFAICIDQELGRWCAGTGTRPQKIDRYTYVKLVRSPNLYPLWRDESSSEVGIVAVIPPAPWTGLTSMAMSVAPLAGI